MMFSLPRHFLFFYIFGVALCAFASIKYFKINQVNSDNLSQKESEQSYACLSKNGYDHSKCEAYFDNYNTCKKFWGSVYKERKAMGIYPYLPEPEERAKIKEEFTKKVMGQK